MTCDEFRKCNAGGIDGILALTRAERSACAQHWTSCFECREWTNTFDFKMTLEQEVKAELAKHADQQDQEVWRLSRTEQEAVRKKLDLDEEVKRGEVCHQ